MKRVLVYMLAGMALVGTSCSDCIGIVLPISVSISMSMKIIGISEMVV